MWSAYAATGLLPDYKLLRTVGRLGERDYVKDILEKMGPSLLNYAEPEGPSMLYHVLLDGRASIRATFLKWALENKVKVHAMPHNVNAVNTDSCANGYQSSCASRICHRNPQLIKQCSNLEMSLMAMLISITILVPGCPTIVYDWQKLQYEIYLT